MTRVCQNPLLPPLNDFISTRTLVQWCTNRCMRDVVLRVKDRALVLFRVCLDGADVLSLRSGFWG